MKYTDYVDRFKDFVKKYPTVTIEAICRAESDLWDNPDCSNRSWTFETMNFNMASNQYFNKYLVTKSGNGFGWDLGAEIGFGFKIKDDTLYLRPFVNGWLYKCCAPWSCLDLGLGAYKITFNPDDGLTKSVIQSTIVFVPLEEKNQTIFEYQLV